MLQLGFLKILHGTELEEKAKEYGLKFSLTPPYEVYETPWLSSTEMAELKKVDKALDRLHNSGRFRRTLSLCIEKYNSPFDLFYEVGKEISEAKGLDDFTDSFYDFLCDRFPECKEAFRDTLVCDRLATNSSKALPKSLFREDPFLAKARKFIASAKPNLRKSIAILYHSRKVVFAEYDKKNHRGEYPLVFLPMEDIENGKN